MKIYATTAQPTTPFDPYVGKDVWVRFEPPINFNRAYIRILSMTPVDTSGVIVLRYNNIPIHTDLDLYQLSDNELYSDMTTVRSDIYYIDNIQDAVAKNVIYTEDLLRGRDIPAEGLAHVLSHDDGKFDKFIGKDVWVSAEYLPDSRPYYIKIINKYGTTIDYVQIPKLYVDRLINREVFYFNDSLIPMALEQNPWAIKRSLISSWKLLYPIDILSTEELQEISNNSSYNGAEI